MFAAKNSEHLSIFLPDEVETVSFFLFSLQFRCTFVEGVRL